ncbi:MAG: serine/threonine-protein kinase [Planctomycetaceae bacterium]
MADVMTGEMPERLDDSDVALADYMRRIDAGESIDRDEFLMRYPQCADELRDYFDSADEIERMAGPSMIRTAYDVDTANDTQVSGVGDSVPYRQPARKPTVTLPQVFGRYRVEKQLGAGAMGAVYLAHDTRLNRPVALKTPTFDATADADLIERFQREASSAANLRHAGICPVFDVGEINGVHFISMAYIEGKPLSEIVDSQKRLPVRTVVSLIRRIAQALDHAHGDGVVHRDLKPANIMIDKQCQPLIMDFGLALKVDTSDQSRITQDGMILGTPSYMSPEQVQESKDAGPQSDIYSLGVILFELLTGSRPFCGPVTLVIAQILTEAVPAPSTRRKEVDPELDAICAKLTARRLEDRYNSIHEVVGELTRYLQSTRDHADSDTESVRRTLSDDDGLADFLATAPNEPDRNSPLLRDENHRSTAGGRMAFSFGQIAAATGLAGIAVLLMWSMTIYMRGASGTLRIVVHDENLVVKIDGETIRFSGGTFEKEQDAKEYRMELLLGDQTLEFDPASSVFRCADADVSVRVGDVTLTGNRFTVGRDGKTVIEIQRVSKRDVASLSRNMDHRPAVKDRVVEFSVAGGTTALAVSPDGRSIAIVNGVAPWRIFIREVRTGLSVSEFHLPGNADETVQHLSYTVDGDSLLCCVGAHWSVIDVKDGSERLEVEFPAPPEVAVFPKRTLALALYHEREEHRTKRYQVPQRLRIWNWQNGEILYDEVFPFERSPHNFPAISPDEKFVTYSREHYHERCSLTIDDGSVSIGKPEAMEQTSRVRGPLVYSTNGKLAATNVKSRQGMAVVLNAETGRIVCRIDPEGAQADNEGHQYGCNFSFTSDSTGIVTADHTGRVTVWDALTGKRVRILKPFQKTGNHNPPEVAATSDGVVIVAGGAADPRVTVQPIVSH